MTWNVAGRRSRVRDQLAYLRSRSPDVVALQEVTPTTSEAVINGLEDVVGLESSTWSMAPEPEASSRRRSLGVLIASRQPIEGRAAHPIASPWREKTLSIEVRLDDEPVDLHTVHVPPGSSNGWVKIDVLEAVGSALRRPSPNPVILTGDFNTPKLELRSGHPEHGLRDAFRSHHGHELQEASSRRRAGFSGGATGSGGAASITSWCRTRSRSNGSRMIMSPGRMG